MSNTRRAKDSSRFHQNRYASSAEFERGLLANLVAKRCALIDSAETRELIWFVQYLSHQEGGLAGLAKTLIEKFPLQIQTQKMAEFKLRPGKSCNEQQLKAIMRDIPGEVILELIGFPDAEATRPDKHSTDEFFDFCLSHAKLNLEKNLGEICLNPQSGGPFNHWYFSTLFDALREHLNDYQKSKGGVFTTALGQKVSDVLDYTAYSGGLTLMEGEARTGKTFAARVWCEQRPGKARFVEVPPTNDDSGFFRAIARGLGLGNFLQYKACEIRERVESVLLTKDLLFVLDATPVAATKFALRFPSSNQLGYGNGQCRCSDCNGIHSAIYLDTKSRGEKRMEWFTANRPDCSLRTIARRLVES